MRQSADTPPSIASLGDPVLAGLALDSRKVEPGYLFAALSGSKADGASFVLEAVKRGAVAILAAPDAVLPPLAPEIVVLRDANPRRRMALMASAYAGLQPATIAAVTGTNGKSSTVHFVRQIWSALGFKAARRRGLVSRSTTISGASGGNTASGAARIATAPRFTASATKEAPSALEPERAANR